MCLVKDLQGENLFFLNHLNVFRTYKNFRSIYFFVGNDFFFLYIFYEQAIFNSK